MDSLDFNVSRNIFTAGEKTWYFLVLMEFSWYPKLYYVIYFCVLVHYFMTRYIKNTK